MIRRNFFLAFDFTIYREFNSPRYQWFFRSFFQVIPQFVIATQSSYLEFVLQKSRNELLNYAYFLILSVNKSHLNDALSKKVVAFSENFLLHLRFYIIIFIPNSNFDSIGWVSAFKNKFFVPCRVELAMNRICSFTHISYLHRDIGVRRPGFVFSLETLSWMHGDGQLCTPLTRSVQNWLK